ncbi:MarR family winged helix-turn-helix transcriptional regulator [Arthrobacter cryoconiti]|uniref:MarR family winged helix-turn-helix transcriptional regulator n=1 Tax=Arthrobacter cryoconiti TaxID=748907 RepID=A0ABV8R216_9MICC|nr:MarR family transcriptional regulator [Arthrobacter cryoconiti]MCC9067890.1 MarR family transcriptional regulator [Arthrobacter cryoconiti]
MAKKMHGLNEFETDLWVALTVLSQVFTPAMDQRLREVGLTLFEYGALMTLSDAPDRVLRISEMAERTYAPVPRMSKVVGRLEERGLVRRAASPSDRRVSDIELTPAGRRVLLAAAKIQAHAAREMVMDRISPTDAAALASILGPLVHSLDPAGPL